MAENPGWANIVEHKYIPGDNSGKSAAGKIGGVRSGESKRAKKQLQNALLAALAVQYPKGSEQAEELANIGLEPTVAQAVGVALIRKALTGDSSAFAVLRDSVGEKPLAGVEITSADVNADNVAELSDDELRNLLQ